MGSWLSVYVVKWLYAPAADGMQPTTCLQVLAATPLLEELTLSGCSQLGSGVLVSASLPARLPPAALGEFEVALLLEHRGPHHLEGVEESREEAAEKLENLSLSCDPAADSQVVPVILIVIILVADPDQN